MRSFLSKTDGAIVAAERGNRTAALDKLGALINEINALSADRITTRAAELLKGDIEYVMAHLP